MIRSDYKTDTSFDFLSFKYLRPILDFRKIRDMMIIISELYIEESE